MTEPIPIYKLKYTEKKRPVFQHVLNGKLRIIDAEMEVLRITHTDDVFHTE